MFFSVVVRKVHFYKMENRFLNCCFDYALTGTRSEYDRLSFEGNHDPVFHLYYHKVNKS